MSRWNIDEIQTGGITGKVDYSSDGYVDFTIDQDAEPFLAEAKRDRDNGSKAVNGFKKFATIPDIVSIEILQKYGLDVHAPDFMGDRDKLNRLKYLIQTDYKHLMAY